MKKVLAALFISLIFCSAVFAENGPKTFDEAIEKFFKDRELDPIEGIWHDEKTGYYAIVKAHKNTLDGKKIIYLDSAASSQKPNTVISCIKNTYENN